MAEEKMDGMKGHPNGCRCMMCSGCGVCGGRGGTTSIFVRIAIILFVFWAGLVFGELKGMLHGEYRQGPGMMQSWGGQDEYYGNYGVPRMMMGAYPPVQIQAVTTKAATTSKQ